MGVIPLGYPAMRKRAMLVPRLVPTQLRRSRFRQRLKPGVGVRPLTAQEIVLSEHQTWTTVCGLCSGRQGVAIPGG